MRVAGDSGTGDQVTTSGSGSDTALLTSQAGGGEIFTYHHHQQPTPRGNFQENKKASVNLYISNPNNIILYWTFLACSFDIPSEVVWCGGGMFVLPMVLMVLCQRPLNIST